MKYLPICWCSRNKNKLTEQGLSEVIRQFLLFSRDVNKMIESLNCRMARVGGDPKDHEAPTSLCSATHHSVCEEFPPDF